jgi:hypothetical protein
MAVVAGSVMLVVKTALLNDPNGAIYPDVAMFPCMNKAYHELQTKMTRMGIPVTKEVTSPPILVPAGTTRLGDGALLPPDLILPVWLGERTPGSTQRYIDMSERNWEPNLNPSTNLIYWVWREDEIKFVGATNDRELLVRYKKGLGNITNANSPVLIINCEVWLAQRTAAIAAITIGSNPSRAKALNDDLVIIWDDFCGTLVHKNQSRPVRRRRTRYRVR